MRRRSYKPKLLNARGERCWVVVRPNGEQEFDATIFLTVDRRPTVGSYNTLGKDARSIAKLFNFCADGGIDIGDRIRTGKFLDVTERSLLLIEMGRGCNDNTRSINLSGCLRYVRFHADIREERLCVGTKADRYAKRSDRLFGSYGDLTRPPSEGDGTREGLVGEAKAGFQRVIASQAACEKIWPSPFVALRFRAFAHAGLLEGHRRDELLNLRKRDIDFETGVYAIKRRPNDVDDTRLHQPCVKGYSRTLKMLPSVLAILAELVAIRDELPWAASHDFVFTTEDGRPLSRSAVNKSFRQFRTKHELVGSDFSAHILRHTWNLSFSAYADEMKLSEAEDMRARMYKMGWRSRQSAARYTLRHDRDVADAVSMHMQSEFLAHAGAPAV